MEQSGQQKLEPRVHLPRELVAFAEEAARECGSLLLEAWRQPKRGYEEKAPGDLVSETDLASEELARSILLTHTPEAHFLAEESADSRSGPSNEDQLTYRGLLATGWPFRRKEILDSYFEIFTRVLRAAQGVRRAGAAAVDLAYTSAGRLEGFWEYGLSIWDIAAGALLVREAGGAVSDFGGGELWWTSGDIVATNGAIHDELLTTVATPNGISDLEIHVGD